MNRKVGLASLIAIMVSASCSAPTPEELASMAAKGYYEHLIHGEYEQFLEGKAGVSAMDADYRSQLLDNYRQFMHRQETTHGGIREVRIANAVTDTVLKYTNVMLVLCFGDSINEEVAVPMVEHNGSWRMK